MSAVLFRQSLGDPVGQSATFSKTEMQNSPFLSAIFRNSYLQKTDMNKFGWFIGLQISQKID